MPAKAPNPARPSPNQASAALIAASAISVTASRKPTPRASAKPVRRPMIRPRRPAPGLSSAPHRRRSAACNSRNTALAPTTVVPMAIQAAMPGPLTRASAASARDFMALASDSPKKRSR